MIKQYVIKYKVKSIPYWYEFSCYAESNDNAISEFIKKETLIGVETFRIVAVLNI